MKNISLLAVFFIAAGIVFCGFGMLTIKNLSSYLGMLGDRVEIVLFLNDSVSEEGKAAMLEKIGGIDVVEKTKYTSKDEALADFKRYNELSDQVRILDKNPLPATIDVYLKEKSPEMVRSVAIELRSMEGVEDVYFTSSEAENLVLLERVFKKIVGLYYLLLSVFLAASVLCLAVSLGKMKIIYGIIDAVAGAAFGIGGLYCMYKFIFIKNFKSVLFFTNPELGIIFVISLILGVAVRIPKNVMEKK